MSTPFLLVKVSCGRRYPVEKPSSSRLIKWGWDLIVRAATSGHILPYTFVLVTIGSTFVLLIGWRTLLISIFPNETKKKNDAYRCGSPFELFKLLTLLVRRW